VKTWIRVFKFQTQQRVKDTDLRASTKGYSPHVFEYKNTASSENSYFRRWQFIVGLEKCPG